MPRPMPRLPAQPAEACALLVLAPACRHCPSPSTCRSAAWPAGWPASCWVLRRRTWHSTYGWGGVGWGWGGLLGARRSGLGRLAYRLHAWQTRWLHAWQPAPLGHSSGDAPRSCAHHLNMCAGPATPRGHVRTLWGRLFLRAFALAHAPNVLGFGPALLSGAPPHTGNGPQPACVQPARALCSPRSSAACSWA